MHNFFKFFDSKRVLIDQVTYFKSKNLEGGQVQDSAGYWWSIFVYVHFKRAHFVDARNQYATNITPLLRKLQT